jgi:hypothetical protein
VSSIFIDYHERTDSYIAGLALQLQNVVPARAAFPETDKLGAWGTEKPHCRGRATSIAIFPNITLTPPKFISVV